MKRNKRTEVVAHEKLAQLTDQILTKMGPEGSAIRQRLKQFYRERAVDNIIKQEPKGEAP